jgi:SAM-dependent methyltransferase
MPTLEYLRNAYPIDYYAYSQAIPLSTGPRIIKRLKRVVRNLPCFHQVTHDPKFETPGTMLDIGCGTGTFLAAMQEKGWKVHGMELDAQAAERGRQAGIDIFGGTIDEVKYPSAVFDYVRSNHSFEHIHNPREVLREIHRIVKPTGRLFIGLPNVAGLMARLYGAYWWCLCAPVHVFGYSPVTLRRLLAEEGFEVERVIYNSNYTGVFGSIQLYLNRNNGKMGEDGWITHSKILMLIGYCVARITDSMRMGDWIEIIARPV